MEEETRQVLRREPSFEKAPREAALGVQQDLSLVRCNGGVTGKGRRILGQRKGGVSSWELRAVPSGVWSRGGDPGILLVRCARKVRRLLEYTEPQGGKLHAPRCGSRFAERVASEFQAPPFGEQCGAPRCVGLPGCAGPGRGVLAER